jgi:hypothetical protein
MHLNPIANQNGFAAANAWLRLVACVSVGRTSFSLSLFFYRTRVGQGDVCVIRLADHFGLTVEHILSAFGATYRTAANEGRSTDLPFCPVSLTFSPSTRADLSTTSCASGAEVVVGPSASNISILHFKYHATPAWKCIRARSNCKGQDCRTDLFLC